MSADIDLWRAVLDRAIRDAHGGFKPYDPETPKSKTLDQQEVLFKRRLLKMANDNVALCYLPLQRIVHPEFNLDVREARYFFLNDGEWEKSLIDICESVDLCPKRMKFNMTKIIHDLREREENLVCYFKNILS